ncbi:MAG: hypothetical protein WKF43_08940 [Acidimicrobiales bacterium]
MSTTFRCLELTFTAEATSPALHCLIDALYAPFAGEGAAASHFGIVGTDRSTPTFEVHADTRCALVTTDAALALAHLVWEIGQAVISASSDGPHLLLHAAAAERNGQAVLLPAPSHSGKSTMVTGLIANGFRYLTDDVAPLDPLRKLILPYPKPISVTNWLWPLFPQLRPLRFAWHPYLGKEGFLTAGMVGATIGEPSVPRLVVVPRYRDEGPTELTGLTAAEAVQLFVEQSFNARTFGPRAVVALTSMVRGYSCYRLDYSDLTEAVRLVSDVLDTVVATTDPHAGIDAARPIRTW